MSYNLSVSNDSSFNRCITEMVSTDTIFDYHSLFDIPFSPLYDSSSDCNLQALLNSNQNQQNQVDEFTCPGQLASGLLPSSPPTDQLKNLSPYQNTQFPSNLSFCPNLESEYENFSSLNCLEDKTEECQVDGDANENGANYLQRSFSSNSFEGKPNFSFQPPFDSIMESQNFQGQAMSMPENSFLAGRMGKVCSTGDLQNFQGQPMSMPENSFLARQMGKVCSTGDLQNMRNVHTNQGLISNPSAIENSFMGTTSFKVGRYNPEERQERISKYRAKRNQRNFNKTIKYACRKTLADSRRRIRGRFARNDETVETPKAAWALHEVEDKTMARGTFMNSFSQHQFQYHHGRFLEEHFLI